MAANMMNFCSPFIRVVLLFLAIPGIRTNGQQFVANMTWPTACGSTMGRDSDGSPCDSFCGTDGSVGQYRSTYYKGAGRGAGGYQYQVCACNASVGSNDDSVTINFRTDTEEACKYDEVYIDLPNTSNETCSDAGLDEFNATRCSEYCNDVVFKDFIDLNDVDGGYKGNVTGGCRCFWGGVAIDACSKSISGGIKMVGFLTTATAIVSVITAFATMEIVI